MHPGLHFITLLTFRRQITRRDVEDINRRFQATPDLKIHAFYYTLGRYDAVLITEAPNAESVMRFALQRQDVVASETMVAIPRDEAVKLLPA